LVEGDGANMVLVDVLMHFKQVADVVNRGA
jgi:hypothetical protein